MNIAENKNLKNILSILHRAICSHSRDKIAIAENNSISIIDISQFMEDGPTLDRSSYKPISKSTTNFEILSLHFNPSYEYYLAVCGIKECRILTLNSKFEIVNQLEIDLSLDVMEDVYILQAVWLPNSKVNLGISFFKKMFIYFGSNCY